MTKEKDVRKFIFGRFHKNSGNCFRYFNNQDKFVSRSQFCISYKKGNFNLTDISKTNLTGCLIDHKAYQIFEGLILIFGKSSGFLVKELQFSFDIHQKKFKQFKLKTGSTTLERYIRKKEKKILEKELSRQVRDDDYIELEGIFGDFKGEKKIFKAIYDKEDQEKYKIFHVGSNNSCEFNLKKKNNSMDDFIDNFHVQISHDQRNGWLIAKKFIDYSEKFSEKAETYMCLKTIDQFKDQKKPISNRLKLEPGIIICADNNHFKVLGNGNEVKEDYDAFFTHLDNRK